MVKGRRLGSSCVSPLVPRAPDLGCMGLDLHVARPTEAAFTLLLYCELLQWEERPLREFLHYPSQSEWQRKEGLCRKIIHYFSKGKVGPAAGGPLGGGGGGGRAGRGVGRCPDVHHICRRRGFLLGGG